MLTTRETILLGLIDALRDSAEVSHLTDEWGDLSTLFTYAQHMRQTESVPDPMPLGWNRPAPARTGEVVRVLLDAVGRVQAGDSFEGLIIWTMPTDEPELEGADFGLMARYRVGNLDGQGGYRVFTGDPDGTE